MSARSADPTSPEVRLRTDAALADASLESRASRLGGLASCAPSRRPLLRRLRVVERSLILLDTYFCRHRSWCASRYAARGGHRTPRGLLPQATEARCGDERMPAGRVHRLPPHLAIEPTTRCGRVSIAGGSLPQRTARSNPERMPQGGWAQSGRGDSDPSPTAA
jgi:hypothetical protein